MNLTGSKKTLALAGVICGLVAACLAYFGNPANMAFCIACFIRDTAGAMGMQDQRLSVWFLAHLLFQLRQKNSALQVDLHR